MKQISKVLFVVAAIACLTPYVSHPSALMLGIILALSIGNPFPSQSKKASTYLLQASVVGLGAGMDLNIVSRVGVQGMGYTCVGIILTFLLGLGLGKLFKTNRTCSLLIVSGTAICGGSAIAAVSSTIRAKSEEISVALGTVFFLNAIALVTFPFLGHHFGLDQAQFGLWSALAIHDTSSVVGASAQYGAEALQIGTTIKLARALWIIPLTMVIGFFWNKKHPISDGAKAKKPWFILGFILVAALVTWIPELKEPGQWVSQVAKKLLVLTLFLIGSGLTRSTLKAVGARPLLQGVLLWIAVSSATLIAILNGLRP